jgi:mono/diheme cytochrome c family protein
MTRKMFAMGTALLPRQGLTIGKGIVTLLLSIATLRAAPMTMDSTRGARLFETLTCVQCHSVNGKGATLAPDLGRQVDRSFTPATLAATMWNHAPTMWSAMKTRDIRTGDLDDQGAADLFAYFYSAHYFDKPGDAGRGKQVFASKHCADCHGLTQPKIAAAKPVAQWDATKDPIALVSAMWNHASTMNSEFAKRGFAWPQLGSQELTDLLVYLRNLPLQGSAPSARSESVIIHIDSAGGQAIFESKGCATCHAGKLDLPPLLKNATLIDIAAAMWNHQPQMERMMGAKAASKTAANAPQLIAHLELEEMRQLIGYVWAREFFEDSGNASRGARVFEAKRCAACHLTGADGAPKLPSADRSFTGATMVSALWRHGPTMLASMQSNHVAWPRFDGMQMADVIAYLNARYRGK